MIKKLQEIANNAYVPYSKFRVAAILETKSGELLTGFNIENAAYPNSMCAERVALYTAINQQKDVSKVVKVYVYSPDSKEFLSPCGGCRQTLSEHLNMNIDFEMFNKDGQSIVYKFSDLLPLSINPKNIKGEN